MCYSQNWFVFNTGRFGQEAIKLGNSARECIHRLVNPHLRIVSNLAFSESSRPKVLNTRQTEHASKMKLLFTAVLLAASVVVSAIAMPQPSSGPSQGGEGHGGNGRRSDLDGQFNWPVSTQPPQKHLSRTHLPLLQDLRLLRRRVDKDCLLLKETFIQHFKVYTVLLASIKLRPSAICWQHSFKTGRMSGFSCRKSHLLIRHVVARQPDPIISTL